MKKAAVPICPYCSEPSAFYPTSERFYHGRDFGSVWACLPCKAWVGCHDGSRCPMGRLADAALRQAKQAAHAAFDPLWRAKMRRDGCSKKDARSRAYLWLAQEMNLPPAKCHIGYFDLVQCKRVVAICAALGRKDAA